MKTKTASILGLALALSTLTGCFTPPTQAQYEQMVAAQGYGAELPSDWQDRIKSFMEMRLKDSTTALWKFENPNLKSWAGSANGQGTRLAVGHVVKALINGKNSYGGYTGYEEYRFIFRDGKIIAYSIEGGTWNIL